ncbi:MAG: aminodeoxychorismate synthase component I [Campylobacterota bacterium]
MKRLSAYAKQNRPFAFVLDFDKSKCIVEPLDALHDISFSIHGGQEFQKHPLPSHAGNVEAYKEAFAKVQKQIRQGNTYLFNLTAPTKLQTSQELSHLYTRAKAKYKVMLKDRFVAFSPETFVQIQGDRIHTYPMKGTIDASIKNAREKILRDPKEKAEHTMIVDLLRNDLGMIGRDVRVERFRYVEDIGGLLQVSSHISAYVPRWRQNLSAIFDAITPAGSITGTPKNKTTQLIKEIEGYNRGFFTGIFGVYDGKSVDSCVLIRYIEKKNNSLYFKSGGGITIDSDWKKEYEELRTKIYLPVQKGE